MPRVPQPDAQPSGPPAPSPTAEEATLADLGEDALLARIFPRLPPASAALVGPGDDAAVVAAPDRRVVATTDVLVEGRDFRLDWSDGVDVGWKAAAQNLADVAAMGAVPTALLVGLVAPGDLAVSWALALADGLRQACHTTGAGVVGGDLSSGNAVVVAVTALGDLQGREAVLRSGARPGDVVAVAGGLGRSAAGLDLLLAGVPQAHPELVDAHLRPDPPYAAAVAAAGAGATSMLDVSDGLLRDLGRVARASDVVLDLSAERLDAAFGAALAGAATTLGVPRAAWILSGGEDHSFAVTFPWGTALPGGFVEVGRVLAADAQGARVLVDGGSPGAVTGWDHFRPS